MPGVDTISTRLGEGVWAPWPKTARLLHHQDVEAAHLHRQPLAAVPLRSGARDRADRHLRLLQQKDAFSAVDYELFSLLAAHAATAIFHRSSTRIRTKLNTIQSSSTSHHVNLVRGTHTSGDGERETFWSSKTRRHAPLLRVFVERFKNAQDHRSRGRRGRAQEAVRPRRIDLILTDINMPVMDGSSSSRWCARTPAQKHPHHLITTEGAEEDRERGLALARTPTITADPFVAFDQDDQRLLSV